MRKTIATLGILIPTLAFPAAATTTLIGSRSVKIACGSGTCDAPTATTVGLNLDAVTMVSIHVAAATGQTLSGAGTVNCYLRDAASGVYGRAKQFDVASDTATIIAVSKTFDVQPRGTLYCVPASVTVSSGGVTVYLVATDKGGAAL